MKQIIIIIFLLYSNVTYGKIGINIIPVKCANEEVITSKFNTKAERLLEREFSKELSLFNIRIRTRKYLKELEAKFSGIVKDTGYKQLEAVDYFIITTIGIYDGLVIYDIRVMDAETVEVVCSIGETVNENKFEDELIKSIIELKEVLKNKASKEEPGKDKEKITVYKIKEDGNKQISETVTGILFTGLNNINEFRLVEREQMNKALEEKEGVMAGMVNRNPLKKIKRFYDIQVAIEGYVVTKNNGIISLELKLINVEKGSLIFTEYDECHSERELRRTVERIVENIANKYLRKLGELEVVSTPFEASVYVDGNYLARTPCLITELDSGSYKLLLRKRNYKDYSKDINIVPKKKAIVKVNLERIEWEYYKLGIKNEKIKKWEKAVSYFTKFINSYSGTQEAKDAKFRVAHIYQYGLKNYSKAIKNYDELISSYSGLKILSESMYGLGQCLINVGEKEKGIGILRKLLLEYSETSAAESARDYLNELNT